MSKLAKEVQALSRQDLEKKVIELRQELAGQKRARAAGELMNAHAIKKTRRSIAVALTLLTKAKNETDKKEEAK